MRGQPAKLLAEADVRALLRAVERRRHPLRNRAMVLLSVRAGLRAGEIAALRWEMIEDPRGRVSGTIELPAFAAKRGSSRRIPIHRELRLVLIKLRNREPDALHVITSERGPEHVRRIDRSSTGSPASIASSVSSAARRTPVGGHS